jgi:hypothetical protein
VSHQQLPLTGNLTHQTIQPPQDRYDYYMIQLPSNIALDARRVQGNELAMFVQDWANRLSNEGWEFYRIDNMNVIEQPGCLSSLFGASQQFIPYSIMTFRRRR